MTKKPRATQTHTGGATDGYVVRKSKALGATPDATGNRADRRAAAKEAKKKNGK
ncbi:hypothetical protein OG292_16590 [Streptomyces sp. NBC_01511]|uniref:hypothetical protein n=1 Tax=unclassified Streptomyces TaxID=2593676 RepID=UPI00386BB958